jgi:hypothetical protein
VQWCTELKVIYASLARLLEKWQLQQTEAVQMCNKKHANSVRKHKHHVDDAG